MRLVAQLKNGQRKNVDFHSGVLTGTPTQGCGLIYARDFDINDVQEYTLERTPWLHGEIKNIVLRPTSSTGTERGATLPRLLQTNTPLPLTLGFRTGSGAEGILQLTRFGEGNQPPVTLRYKLASLPSPHAFPTRSAVLRATADDWQPNRNTTSSLLRKIETYKRRSDLAIFL